jgi:hypothetical protein
MEKEIAPAQEDAGVEFDSIDFEGNKSREVG